MGERGQRRLLLETLKWTARTIWGLLLCSALAVGSGYLFSNHPYRVFLPILFVVVIVAVAVRYGVAVGILGSIISAVIFAHLLYAPLHSFHVIDSTARASLAWMILGGIAIPYLVVPGLRSQRNKK
jgi:K+-sensing histidine kinase KdpD